MKDFTGAMGQGPFLDHEERILAGLRWRKRLPD